LYYIEQKQVTDVIHQQIGPNLSSRERNRAKRRAKHSQRQPSRDSPL